MRIEIENYIKTWELRCYFEGIPDEAPYRLCQLGKVPSYRKICFAILKNDKTLKSLGLAQKKSRYYHLLKKIELKNRKGLSSNQLELF